MMDSGPPHAATLLTFQVKWERRLAGKPWREPQVDFSFRMS